MNDELRARQRELAHSQARPVRALQLLSYKGLGWNTQTVTFGCYFLEEPIFTWGVRIVDEKDPWEGAMQPKAFVSSYLTVEGSDGIIDRAVVLLTAESYVQRNLQFSLCFETVGIHVNDIVFRDDD